MLRKNEISKFQLDDFVDFLMLKNAYLLAKIDADTAENKQTVAEIFTNFLT